MDFLKHFNVNRHHVTNPEGKQKAREFIKQTFQDLGLVAWFEKFKPDYPKVTICCMLSIAIQELIDMFSMHEN